MTSPEGAADIAAPKNGVDAVKRKPVMADAEKQSEAPAPTATATATAGPAEPGPATTEKADAAAVTDDDGVNPLEFEGEVDSNHDLPTPETIRKIDDHIVLDRDGKSHSFRSLYTGRHAARRVLVIFIRHFYCGNCQEYLRTLSESITPSALLALPQPTFICVIGCGDPALIDMYATATNCPFPIYSDPTRRLYTELGMVRTLALGARPAYMKQHLLKSSVLSVVQGLKQIRSGLALKGGDAKQIGGEFLFEPVGGGGAALAVTPMEAVPPPEAWDEAAASVQRKRQSETSLDGKGEPDAGGEDKVVTWCHRMRNTRDHAEVPELMEVLGLDGTGKPVGDKERWERAVRERKGTGVGLVRRSGEVEGEVGKGEALKGEALKGEALKGEAGTTA